MDVDRESSTTGMDTSKASVGGVTGGCGCTSGVRTKDDSQSDNDICPSWVKGEGSRRSIVILPRLHYYMMYICIYICTMAMDDIHHGDRPQSQQQPNAFTSPQVVDHIV